MKNTRRILFAGVLMAMSSFGAFATEGAGPLELIQANYKVIDGIVKSGKEVEAMRMDIKGAMKDVVDYAEFARLTVKSAWETFDTAEQTEFVELLKLRIENNYAKRFKPDNTLKVVYKDEPKLKKGKAKVSTSVSSGDVTADVDYLIHQSGEVPVWRVYDIVIDDVSMMRNYRTQFKKLMDDGGKTELFKTLREGREKD